MEVLSSDFDTSMENDDLHYYSSNTDIVSSLQLDKRVKSRSYSSQFTLNDRIQVAVDRREEYKPIENKVTIEVDISLGICDDDESVNKRYIVRLNDMATENTWVYRMINYDTFVDKDISSSIRDDAMEPNKLYLLQHRQKRRTEDVLNFHDGKRKLRTTGSQYNPIHDKVDTGVNPNDDNKKVYISHDQVPILRNELFINTGTPRYEYITDKTYTSVVSIDLKKPNPESNKTSKNFHTFNEIVIPVPKKLENNEDVLKSEFNHWTNSISLPMDHGEVVYAPRIDDQCARREDSIPFAEETDDEQSNRINPRNTLSKYLQYYLPSEKTNDEGDAMDLELHSEVSTGMDSSTETESVNGFLEDDMIVETPRNNIACFDDFNYLSPDEDSITHCPSKEARDIVDSGERSRYECSESIKIDDIIVQEDMVLQVEAISAPRTVELDISDIRKEKGYFLKGKVVEPKPKSVPSKTSSEDDFISVSARRLQYEELNRMNPSIITSKDPNPMKIKLITSDNYSDIIDIKRSLKEGTNATENKENELDKESLISVSSGSMIVKDVLSDENFEFFLTHNNLEIASPDKSFDEDNSLEQVEEQSEYEYSETSDHISTSKRTPENPEDLSYSYSSAPEIDATSASSFTNSANVLSFERKELTKAPIECSSDGFQKFLEYRQYRISEVPISSLPISRDNQSNSSDSDDSYDEDNDKDYRISTDLQKINDPADVDHGIKQDRNSPLTSISRTSSVSSSVFSTSSELTNEVKVSNKDALATNGKDGKCEVQIRRSSGSSSSTDDVTHSDEEIPMSKDPRIMSNPVKIAENELPSSDWSSSSQKSGRDKLNPKYQVVLKNENIPKKEVSDTPIQSSMEKFEKFLQEKNKKQVTTSGTEDTSSSSSDYLQPKSNQIILRQGDSIEDIEELLMQQNPNFEARRSFPLRKQASLPNNSKLSDSDHSYKQSLDYGKRHSNIEKRHSKTGDLTSSSSSETESEPTKNKSIENKELLMYHDNNNQIKPRNRNVSSSSGECTLSSSTEESDLEPKNGKKKSSSQTTSNKKAIREDQTQSSSTSHTESTSSDEDNAPRNKASLDRLEGDINSKQSNSIIGPKKLGNSKELVSEHSSTGSETLSSSSDEDQKVLTKISINCENKLENETAPNKEQKLIFCFSPISTHSTLSSTKEEPNGRDNKCTDHRENFQNSPRISSIKVQTKHTEHNPVGSNHSSSDSETVSSSSEDESHIVENISIDHQEKFIYLTKDDNPEILGLSSVSGQSRPRRSSTRNDILSNSLTDPVTKILKPVNGQSQISRHSSSGSTTASSSSEEESEINEAIDECRKDEGTFIKAIEPVSKGAHIKNEDILHYPPFVGSKKADSSDHREKFEDPNEFHHLEFRSKENKSEKPISVHSSSSSCTLSSSSEEESNHFKAKSIDRREKFQNHKQNNTIERPRKVTNPKEPTFDNSSSDSDTEYDEESGQVKYNSIDRREKFADPNEYRFRNSRTKSQNDKKLDNNTPFSVDHREKFLDPKRISTLEHQMKLNHRTDSESLASSSDEDDYVNQEMIRQCRNMPRNEKDSVSRQSSAKSSRVIDSTTKELRKTDPISAASIDRLEKFDDPKRRSTIERSRNPAFANSSTDSDTLSSSSEEEIDRKETMGDRNRNEVIESHGRSNDESDPVIMNLEDSKKSNQHDVRSIDHLEKFVNPDKTNTIQSQKSNKKIKESISNESESEESSLSFNKSNNGFSVNRPLYSSSNKESNPAKSKSIDHQETISGPLKNNTIDVKQKSNYSSSDSDTISSSSDEEENVQGIPKSVDRREKLENPKVIDTLKFKRKINDIEVLKEPISAPNKSIDHRETTMEPGNIFIVKKQKNLCNGNEDTSGRSSSSSYTKSNSNGGDLYKGVSPQNRNVTRNIVIQENKLPQNYNVTSSELSDSVTSEDSFIFDKENSDKKENSSQRRYQTLPVKRLPDNIPFKEKSKSLDKPVTIEPDQFNKTSYRGSTVDMVEKKYHEFTETWSRQSPIDDMTVNKNVKSNQWKDSVRSLNSNSRKRPIGPLTNNPRPYPSYLSPVNAYPYVTSSGEFGSNDSIASNYSADLKANEISTRNSSVQDFIKDLSNNKLYKSPPPITRPVISSSLRKPNILPLTVNLNYGAEEDKVDYPKPKKERRTSANSVTTDSSYLDMPTLSKKHTKTNLAKLDSLTSSSMSSISTQRNNSRNRNLKANASISSASTSTCSVNSNPATKVVKSPISSNSTQRNNSNNRNLKSNASISSTSTSTCSVNSNPATKVVKSPISSNSTQRNNSNNRNLKANASISSTSTSTCSVNSNPATKLVKSPISSNSTQSNNSNNRNLKANASISSTSTSTCSLNSNPATEALQSPKQSAPNNNSQMSSNQIYRERSKLINGSNIYPVKTSDMIRRKIPSTSESSEYSSTSDDDSSTNQV